MDPPLDPPVRIREISRTPLSTKQTIKSLTAFLDGFEARRLTRGEKIEDRQVAVAIWPFRMHYRLMGSYTHCGLSLNFVNIAIERSTDSNDSQKSTYQRSH
ncbi:hypothetical protein AX14_012411 [Amanita brunnescens Koide BX004]|nr:hypothetical protein AX14_012411 [Amanita brunnescens Koide BX004]